VLLLIHFEEVHLWIKHMPYLSDKEKCGIPSRVNFSVMFRCKRSSEFQLENATQTSLLSRK
jgi:hypothetical protein